MGSGVYKHLVETRLFEILEFVEFLTLGRNYRIETYEILSNTGAGSNAPAIAGERIHDYREERDILFNMIFRLQRRIDDLSAELTSLRGKERETAPQTSSSLIPATPTLLPRFQDPQATVTETYPGLADATPVEAEEVSSVSTAADAPAEPMTLEDTERRTIAEALERNGGRRKATAKELKISERTLYRKIREYGLE